ncbi:putative membrane protein [Sphingomonas jejuensis]|uniref:Membrane protein n=1 Tax=Sphingomonas jejuensis TaxID=904715 RepID=A0ABX0XJ79_9SPHN|nr:hypothetical protein [Sphingomonas jejuensis]NJC32932.1 putative membrane protein [Sphingomonas jejuensis]
MRRRLAVLAIVAAAGGCATTSGGLATADLVAGTNEPFYSMEVTGDRASLTGVDMSPRTLRISRRAAEGGGVLIDAADGAGTVRLLVRPQACTDDMSGAVFPLSATLSIAGRDHRGCARRLSRSAAARRRLTPARL